MKRSAPSQVSADDSELFRKTVGPVKPLREDRFVQTPRRRQGRARFTKAGRLAAIEASLTQIDPLVVGGETLSHRRPGVPENVLRKLRRGEYGLDAELDLHGLNVAQAKHALHDFLAGALARHALCVRIIHGKGLRSGSRGPVIKSAVDAVLRQTSAVAAYASAGHASGGTGAVHVLLSTR
ncbi:MAG: Smr/MutS family protein [Gammaproteobacteria bacterium]